jgi:uncharacterized protein (UPF0147 family)
MSNTQENDNNSNSLEAALGEEVRGYFYEDVIHKMDTDALFQSRLVFIELIQILRQKPHGAHRVETELTLWLEEVFKHTAAFQTAFELYASIHGLACAEAVVRGNELAGMLNQIMKQKLDGPPRITLLRENSAQQDRAASPSAESGADWAQRFGNMIAEMYVDKNFSYSFDAISGCVIDLVTAYADTSRDTARNMLPVALSGLFDTDKQPKITVCLLSARPGKRTSFGLGEIREGDICENFKKLIGDLGQFSKLALGEGETDSTDKGNYALEVALEREDGEKFELYHDVVSAHRINSITAWAKERFSRSNKESQTAEPPQTAPDVESSAESEAVSGNNVFLRTLAKMAADPQTPQTVSSKLLSIINWVSEEHHAKSTGKLIADLIEDQSLPKAIRDAVYDAAEDIMNKLNRGNEMTLAWVKVYYDQAIKEGR